MKNYITLLLLAICPLAVVAENEPTAASSVAQDYAAVAAKLEPGGDLYAIMQTRGVVDFIAKTSNDFVHALRNSNPELAAKIPPLDYARMEKHLLLSQIKAIGASSVKTEGGDYSIRIYYHMDGKPDGIWKLVKPEPFPFEMIHHAPADATDVAEIAFDLTVLKQVVNGVGTDILGEAAPAIVANFLSQKVPETDVSYDELIEALSNRLGMVTKLTQFSADRSPPIDRHIVVRLKNVGDVSTRLIPFFEAFFLVEEDESQFRISSDPELGEQFEIRILKRDNSVWFSTDITFLENCLNPEISLANTDSYKSYAAKLDGKGIAYSYTSPNLSSDVQTIAFDFFDSIEAMVAPARKEGETLEPLKQFLANNLNLFHSEAYTVTLITDDGILNQSYTKHAGRDYAITVGCIVPAGLVSAMAVPAFMKVRNASQEKTVMNQLRMFAAAGQMYMLDNGIPEVSYEDIVGPGKEIEALESVAGESYEDLWMDIDTTELSVELPDGRVITYEF